MNKTIKILWAAAGLVCFGLGTAGVVFPILPTVPFYMGALFCFAKGSQRLHDWFVGTGLYKKHLESFAKERAMTMKSKLSVVITVTILMALGFIMMKRVPVGRVILTAVWIFHLIYFFFGIKTIEEKNERNLKNNSKEGENV